MTRPTTASIIDYGDTRIIERPEGFYCRNKLTGEESGPFASLPEALANVDNAELEMGEDLREIEDELGIADWLDPDTGEPAEESVPHIEDH